MATSTNRSPWQVKLNGQDKHFRLKSQVITHLAGQGNPEPEKLPEGALRQLHPPEVQSNRKVRAEATRSQTLDPSNWQRKGAARQL